MQKHAITLGVYVLIASACTAFFRWVQNLSAFELETGLMIPNILWSKVAFVVCLAALGGIVFMVSRFWYRNYYPAQTYEQLFVGDPYWIDRITKLIAGIMIAGAAVNFFIGTYSVYRNLQGVLSLLAIATAVAFVQLSDLPWAEEHSSFKHGLWSAIPVVFYMDWITVSYRTHAVVPSVWSFAPEIFAIGMCIIAAFYFAGYGWDFPRPYAALGCGLAAALLSLMTLMDERNLGQQMMLIAGAAMFLYNSWMIVVSMKAVWPSEAETDAPTENE